ncbi:hypothetical protein Bbelb_415500 [Branchiostoma belcheri]|nr:hypothetical protein Bbelb_415500 [Branchiostoma belcheri]
MDATGRPGDTTVNYSWNQSYLDGDSHTTIIISSSSKSAAPMFWCHYSHCPRDGIVCPQIAFNTDFSEESTKRSLLAIVSAQLEPAFLHRRAEHFQLAVRGHVHNRSC